MRLVRGIFLLQRSAQNGTFDFDYTRRPTWTALGLRCPRSSVVRYARKRNGDNGAHGPARSLPDGDQCFPGSS